MVRDALIAFTIVIGLGFRAGATLDSLRDACRAAFESVSGPVELNALATAIDKTACPALDQLAIELGLPVIGVPLDVLAAQSASRSVHGPERYGRRSLAEAAALAAVGPNGRLLGSRVVSNDRMATAALASSYPITFKDVAS